MKSGIVIKSTGSWYSVFSEGNVYQCRLRGIFKLKDEKKQNEKKTNPIAVGDKVKISQEKGLEVWMIEEIEPRFNYIIRRATNLSMGFHVIAANISQAFLVVTIHTPKTSLGFIDRFLVSAESYRIPVTLVFNKSDIYDTDDLEYFEDIKAIYKNIGYDSILVSAEQKTNLEQLKTLIKNKTTLFSGHSGSGKSSLVNVLAPKIQQKTSEVSAYSSKGTHTTTFAEMFHLGDDSFIIDTPGIKELGIAEIEKEELSHYFPEMRKLMNKCKFNNCQHINEPGCAVKKAVENAEICISRYESYLSIYNGDDNRR